MKSTSHPLLAAVLLGLGCGALLPQGVFAETLQCKFARSEGDAKLVPTEVIITTRPNSGGVIVKDSLNAALGRSQVDGEEDGLRKKSRRFTWRVEDLPLDWLTATQKVDVARRLLLSVTVNENTGRATSSAQSARNVGKGRCTIER